MLQRFIFIILLEESFHGKVNQEPKKWKTVCDDVLSITLKRKPASLMCKKV